MKKIFALTLIAALFLVACSSNSTSSTKQASDAPKEEKKEEKKEESNKIELNKPMKLGDYTVTFTEYKIVQNHDKKPVLRVTYDWKNESKDDAFPFITFSLKGFQDGIETDRVFVMSEEVELGTGQKEVKPGGEVKGAHTIIGITSLDKPLKLELEKMFNFTDEKLEAELNLGDYK